MLGTILPRFSREPELSNSISLLIDMLRTNLLIADKAAVSLQEECDTVKKYVSLHHLTHDGQPLVQWHVDPALSPSTMVPTMCLQLPVENALKHAFPTPQADARVDIEARHVDERICLSVTDNGVGYNPGTIHNSGRDTGTGLRVLARTIDILNTRNVVKARFSISARQGGQGTVVAIDFPDGYNWEL